MKFLRNLLATLVGLTIFTFGSIFLFIAIISALENGTSTPIATVSLTILGLTCYLYHSIKRGDVLYTAGNLIGIVGNIILLGCLL